MSEGEEKRPVLPPGWRWATIGDIAGYVNRGRAPTYTTEGGYPVINQRCIRWSGIDFSWLKYTTEESFKRVSDAQRLRSGDVLWNSTGTGTLGRAAVFDAADRYPEIMVDTHVTIVRTNGYEPRLLQYWIYSNIVQQRLRRLQIGSTNQIELSRSAVLQFPIPVPPAYEQRRIVERIDELFGEIEAGEQELAKAQEALQTYRRAVMKAAVTGELTRDWRENNFPKETGQQLLDHILRRRRAVREESKIAVTRGKGRSPAGNGRKSRYQEPLGPDVSGLPELPRGWAWASLDQLCWDSSYGTSEKCVSEPIGVAILRIPNVQNGAIVFSDLKYVRPASVANMSMIEPGDFLVVRTNGSEKLIGRGTVVTSKLPSTAYFASYLIRFRLIAHIDLWRWIAIYWNSYVIRTLVNRHAATSAGQYNISQKTLLRFPIPIPGAQELCELVSRLDAQLGAANVLEKNLMETAGTAELRQSVLSAAFSGKLAPQDATEEPATALLDRLRTAKIALTGRTRGGGAIGKAETRRFRSDKTPALRFRR